MTIRGQMIHRLSLQERKNTVNSAFETNPNPTWADVTKCWAKIVPVSGSEYQQADQQQAKITHVITIWNIQGLTDRIKSNMRFFDPKNNLVFNVFGYRKQFIQKDRVIVIQCIEDESLIREEGE
jgi:SPP1 family predicted phage head-tail adaptor